MCRDGAGETKLIQLRPPERPNEESSAVPGLGGRSVVCALGHPEGTTGHPLQRLVQLRLMPAGSCFHKTGQNHSVQSDAAHRGRPVQRRLSGASVRCVAGYSHGVVLASL